MEGELTQLFTAEEIKTLSLDEIKTRVDSAMDYNEFAWLDTKPHLRYKSKTLAVGLENILCRCPSCGAHYSIRTMGREVFCEQCDLKAVLDSRYGFIDGVPFKNFAAWYEWQTEEIRREIAQNPDFALESDVLLKHSSKDGETRLRDAGKGVCRLDRNGLRYLGEEDGAQIEKFFPMQDIYRLLFAAGENFEIYEGMEIWHFVPTELRSCIAWYIASGVLKENSAQ